VPGTGAAPATELGAAVVAGVVGASAVVVVVGGIVVGTDRRGGMAGAASAASPAMIPSVADTPMPVARTRPPGATQRRRRT
jgi:hypothetical protein